MIGRLRGDRREARASCLRKVREAGFVARRDDQVGL